VLAVGVEVEQVVDDVGGGGAEAEAKEGEGVSGDEAGCPGVGEQQRNEDEGVFGPLVETDGFEPGFEGGCVLVEGTRGSDTSFMEAGEEARGRIGDHGLLAMLEDGQVRRGVTDVGEVVAKVGLEGGELVFACEVELAVGGENAGEETEMGGDAVGGVGVGGGGEVDRAAGGALLLKILKEFAIVGEVGDVELDGVGQVVFESSFALEEPAGKLQKGHGMMTGYGEGRVVKSVRLNESPIKVDAEDREGGCAGRRRGDGQKRPFLRLISNDQMRIAWNETGSYVVSAEVANVIIKYS